jgi:putative ABC transport system substrate-binding protein
MLTAALMPKRPEFLSELVPRASVFGLLVNPNTSIAKRMIAEVEEAASAKGVWPEMLKTGNEGKIDAAFARLAQLHADPLVVIPDPFFLGRREQLVALASRDTVPAIYPLREFAAIGGLISYAASITAAFHLLGTYAGRVLRGRSPLICRSSSRPNSS